MQRDATPASGPTLAEATKVWARIGFLSFGGPAGQIALMHRILVDEKKWVDEGRYLSALNFCMLLPGPEAMQLATYVGWSMHGLRGGLVAGLLFVGPGAVIVLALALLYAAFGSTAVAVALFVGIKAAVLAIVVEALLRVGRRALKGAADWLVSAAAFLAIHVLDVPFPLIVLMAALIGFARGGGSAPSTETVSRVPQVSAGETARTVLIWLTVWIVPLLAITAIFGADHVLAQLAWFFSKLAVVSFGGAYAVLAYMAQEAVESYKWLSAGEMLDVLGLAETTPGPLILVTEFVGTLAAYRSGGMNPVVMGVLGALVTLWATFAPCFLWIFAAAPYVERLNAEPRLRASLQSVTAAVVGVIFNLTVWFALHVLFHQIERRSIGPLHFYVPDWAWLDTRALALAVLAMVLLFALQRGVVTTLAICGGLALLLARFDWA